MSKRYLVKKAIKITVNMGSVLEDSKDGIYLVDTISGLEVKISDHRKEEFINDGFLEVVKDD